MTDEGKIINCSFAASRRSQFRLRRRGVREAAPYNRKLKRFDKTARKHRYKRGLGRSPKQGTGAASPHVFPLPLEGKGGEGVRVTPHPSVASNFNLSHNSLHKQRRSDCLNASACRQSLVYTLSDDEKRTSAIVFDLFGQKRQLRCRHTNGKDAVKRTPKVHHDDAQQSVRIRYGKRQLTK